MKFLPHFFEIYQQYLRWDVRGELDVNSKVLRNHVNQKFRSPCPRVRIIVYNRGKLWNMGKLYALIKIIKNWKIIKKILEKCNFSLKFFIFTAHYGVINIHIYVRIESMRISKDKLSNLYHKVAVLFDFLRKF